MACIDFAPKPQREHLSPYYEVYIAYRLRIRSSVPCWGRVVVVATMNYSTCTADDDTDLKQNHQRPDTARATAATALCSHGNSGAVSSANTDFDEPANLNSNNKTP